MMGVYIKGVTVEELMKVLICSTEFMPDGFEIVQTHNVGDMVSRSYLLSEYDRQHQGPAGGARKIIEEAPSAEQWIPCSKRFPDRYGKVLVTFIPSAGALWTKVIIAHYSDLMGIAKPCFWIGNVGHSDFCDITNQVTAWMPLPKPYRKESSND